MTLKSQRVLGDPFLRQTPQMQIGNPFSNLSINTLLGMFNRPQFGSGQFQKFGFPFRGNSMINNTLGITPGLSSRRTSDKSSLFRRNAMSGLAFLS